jgi:hypothetical protein
MSKTPYVPRPGEDFLEEYYLNSLDKDFESLNDEQKEIKLKGKPFTCRVCNFKFKLKLEDRKSYFVEKEKCPSCGTKWCSKPNTERELLQLQDDFYENNKSEAIATKMYNHLRPYAKSLIYKSFINAVESEQDVEYHSHQAASYLMEEFYKNRNKKHIDDYRQFYVFGSFAGFLVRKIQLSIFGKHEYQVGDVSLDEENDEKKKIYQIEDEKNNQIDKVINDSDSLNLLRYMEKLLFSIDKYCDDKHENVMRLLAIRNFLSKGEKSSDRLFNVMGRKGKHMFLKSMEIMKGELMKNS